MPDGFGVKKPARGIGQLRQRVVGMLVAVACEREQRLELADRFDPLADVRPGDAPPALDRDGDLQAPENRHGDGREENVALPVKPRYQSAQPGDLTRRAQAARIEARLPSRQ